MASMVDPLAHYLKTHEWVRPVPDVVGEFYAGISDHAQQEMSDIVFAEVPRVGAKLAAGEIFGVVESVKAASDVFMPMSGTITAVNQAVEASPEVINQEPYGSGWMIRFKADTPDKLSDLMDAAAYTHFLSEIAH